MNANEIYNNVLNSIFDLKYKFEMEIIFGNNIGESFKAWYSGENEVSVEYLGKTNKVQLPKSIDTISDKLLSKYIMKGFAELYLNKIPNNNMNESILSKIISESIKKVLKESKEQNEVVLQTVETEYVKTSKYGNPMFKVIGETTDGEQFEGYTSPNSSCAYACRGLSSEHLIRKQQLLKVTYNVTPKGRNSIHYLDFINKY